MKLMRNILLVLQALLLLAGCHDGHEAPDTYKQERRARSHAPAGSMSHYCGHPTQKGAPCKRKVSGSAGYCWQHR